MRTLPANQERRLHEPTDLVSDHHASWAQMLWMMADGKALQPLKLILVITIFLGSMAVFAHGDTATIVVGMIAEAAFAAVAFVVWIIRAK